MARNNPRIAANIFLENWTPVQFRVAFIDPLCAHLSAKRVDSNTLAVITPCSARMKSSPPGKDFVRQIFRFSIFQFTLIWTFYYFILRWNDTLHSSLFRGLQAAGAFLFDSLRILKWNGWLKFTSNLLIQADIKFLFPFKHFLIRNVLEMF